MGGDKDRAEFFEIIAMMCPGLKLVLKSKAALFGLIQMGNVKYCFNLKDYYSNGQ